MIFKVYKNVSQRFAFRRIEELFNPTEFPDMGVNFVWWHGCGLWEAYMNEKEYGYKRFGDLEIYRDPNPPLIVRRRK